MQRKHQVTWEISCLEGLTVEQSRRLLDKNAKRIASTFKYLRDAGEQETFVLRTDDCCAVLLSPAVTSLLLPDLGAGVGYAIVGPLVGSLLGGARQHWASVGGLLELTRDGLILPPPQNDLAIHYLSGVAVVGHSLGVKVHRLDCRLGRGLGSVKLARVRCNGSAEYSRDGLAIVRRHIMTLMAGAAAELIAVDENAGRTSQRSRGEISTLYASAIRESDHLADRALWLGLGWKLTEADLQQLWVKTCVMLQAAKSMRQRHSLALKLERRRVMRWKTIQSTLAVAAKAR